MKTYIRIALLFLFLIQTPIILSEESESPARGSGRRESTESICQ